MIIIRKPSARKHRKEQQKRAQEHLDREVPRDPIFKVNKLTGEQYFYTRTV